jgi:GNAT superfamily N-acetyltransferase
MYDKYQPVELPTEANEDSLKTANTQPRLVLWYGPTRTAAAYAAREGVRISFSEYWAWVSPGSSSSTTDIWRAAIRLVFVQLYPSFSSVAARRIWILNDLLVTPPARRRGVGRALAASP